MRISPTLAVALSLAAPALAQTAAPGVSVDYGALDNTPSASSPAPGSEAPVVLKPPLAPVVLTPPPAPKRQAIVLPPQSPKKPHAPPPSVEAAPSESPPSAAAPGLTPPKPEPVAAPAMVAGPARMVRFAKSDIELSDDARATLDQVAASLAANAKLRLELVAHAAGDPDDPVAARRVALQRAIATREYLIGHGVDSVRMDVKALGDKDAGDGPLDRVDLVLVAR